MSTKLALRALKRTRICSALCAGSIACASVGCDDSAAPDKKLLSSQGLYSDIAARKPVAEALEYEPDYPLWSDGVQKRRWLILPHNASIDTTDMDHWLFPVGSKLFKEFALHGQLLETRMVERVASTGKADKDYRLATYVWREDQTDAVEYADGVQDIFGTDHNVPPQKVCQDCHRGERGRVLGVSALQLSRSGLLTKLAERGLLSLDPKRTYMLPGDEVETAAAGYMHANCGHCHAEEGQAPGSMHLRFSVNEVDNPIEQSELYETTIHQRITDWKDHPEEFTERVVPGDPEHSAIYYRMKQRGDEMPSPDQMPPLATEKVHLEGVAAVKAWIELLKEPAKPKDSDSTQPAADDSAKPSEEHATDDGAAAKGGAAGAGGAKAEAPAANSGEHGTAPAGQTAGSRPPDSHGDVPSEPNGTGGASGSSSSGDSGSTTAQSSTANGSAGAPAPGSTGGGGAAVPAPDANGGAGAAAPSPATGGNGGAGAPAPAVTPSSTAGAGGIAAPSPTAGSTAVTAGQGGMAAQAGVGGTDGDRAGSGGGEARPTQEPWDPDGDGDDDSHRHGHAGAPAPH